jgi:hypothetical protein
MKAIELLRMLTAGKNYRKGCNKSLKGEGSTMTRELKTINPATEESH